jgi:TonB family protein
MNTFINYALQANLALLFFLFVETVFFKGEKAFTVRRFFLLAGIVVAMSIPLLKRLISSLHMETLKFTVALAPITVSDSIEAENFSLGNTLSYFYFTGVAIFAFHLLKQFFQLFRALSKPYQLWNDLRVYESENPQHVFSFFRLVSINSKQFSVWERSKILHHELVHAQRWHSVDILLISLIQILFWFNPLLYFYKRKLIQLHEFEADARSVQNEEVDLYCSLLAKVALQSTGFPLANHFIQPFTLNRISMMKSTNKKMHPWKIVMTASCTILFLSAMCFYEPVMAQKNNTQEEVFTQVDDLPVYPGGQESLFKFLGKEVKYPEAARKSGLQGTSIISFVIEKDGSVSSATIMKGFNKECDDAALHAIQAMPKWAPGKKSGKTVRSSYVLPIQFKL